ncbi:phospholipase-like protein [Tanacetum coccineum]
MSDLYDVKISVKLLPEIKGLLSMKPNHENLFRDTIFGPWLDIQSHENDSHMMHYVFQHQVSVPNLRHDCPPIIFHIGDHCELVFMGNEKRNFLTKHIMWLVDDLDAWNAFLWGEYMWEKFYNRTVNVVSRHTEHHLAQLKKNPNFNATYNLYEFAWAFKIWILESYPKSKKWWSKKANVIPRGLAWSKVTMFEKSDFEELYGPMSNPNVPLIASPEEMSHAWFKDSAEFIKGLDAQDGTFLQDDQCREKSMEQHNGMCGDTEDGTFVHRVVGKICPKMNRMSVDDGDGVLDSQSDDGDGVLDSQTKDVIEEASMLPTMSSNSPQAGNAAVSEFFAEFDALKKEVLLIKQRKDDEFYELTKRFSKLETSETFVKFKKLLTNDLCTENESSDCNPKKSDGGVSIEEKPNFSSHHNDSSNHIGGVSSEAKDLYSNSQHHLHLLIKGLGTKIENPSIDSVLVVPPKVDDPMLRTIKPKDDFDEADVDSYDDDYMSMFNDEEQPAKSSLNDLELQQEPDIVDVKDGILEQQANADKGKTIIIQETVGVKAEEKPSLGRGLGTLKFKKKNYELALRPNYVLRSTKIRKKKMAMSLKSTPVPTKRKTRLNKTEDVVLPYDLENLSRPDGCKSDKVTVPEYMSAFINNKDLPEYRFPWGKRDIVIGRSFWLSLSCLNIGKSGWLTDQHLDVWIDLMWSLRPPEADWAIVSPHFSTCILNGMMQDYFSNGHMYPLPWIAVEKVYFLVNEPKQHWCLARLEIRTGVVTFYDLLGWAGGSRRCWWRRMKKVLPKKLTLYLLMHGIFESKGLSADHYKITYNYASVPFQASLYGDYGIWVCIFIYRLCRNLPVAFDNDPLETAYNQALPSYMLSLDHNLTYSPLVTVVNDSNLLQLALVTGYVPAFNSQPKSDKILLGFGVHPDTLDPTIIKVSYPRGRHGNWYVSVFTLSSMDWKKLDNDCLPRESIIFKCSSQVVIGWLIFWAGHERFVSDDGHIVLKKHLLVSFDLIGHSFQVHNIDVVFRDGLTVLMCLSSIGNSLILSGSTDEIDWYLFCGWYVLVDDTSLTSFTLLFAIPTPNYVKLLGFTMDEISLPIVEVPGPHQLANSVQVLNISTQTLQNLGIQGVAGSFFIEQYKESLILLPYPDCELYHMFLA